MHENANRRQERRLQVHEQLKGDVYRDIVRIAEEHRRDSQGRLVREGTIARLIVSNERSKIVWLRGMQGETRPWIRMDDKTRNDLGVIRLQKYGFRIERIAICGQLRWALDSSDPAVRIAVSLGGISVVLGVVGLLIALVSLFRG